MKSFTTLCARAALLAAFFAFAAAGCDTDPVVPPGVNPTVGFVLPPAGEWNARVLPQEPVSVRLRVQPDTARLRVFANGQPLAIPLSAGEFREFELVLPQDTVVLEAVVYAADKSASATVRGWILPNSEKFGVQITAPLAGDQFEHGDPVPCSYQLYNDRGFVAADAVWRLNSQLVVCEERQLEAEPEVGFHTLKLDIAAPEQGLEAGAEAAFEVVPRPWQFTFGEVDAARENSDFWLGDISGRLEQLTFTQGPKGHPAFSADGARWAYAWWNEETRCRELTVSDIDNTNVQTLSRDECDTRSPSWSPDGNRIAYIGSRPGTPNFAAYLINADGTGKRLIPSLTCLPPSDRELPCFGNNGTGIAFMPNGREVVFSLLESTETGNRHVVLRWDLASDTYVRLFEDIVGGEDGWLGPMVYSVSPDGQWVLARAFYTSQIILIRADGSGEMRLLTPEHYQLDYPFVCGGEERVYYVPRNKRNSLRSVDFNGAGDREERVFTISNIWWPRCHPPFE